LNLPQRESMTPLSFSGCRLALLHICIDMLSLPPPEPYCIHHGARAADDHLLVYHAPRRPQLSFSFTASPSSGDVVLGADGCHLCTPLSVVTSLPSWSSISPGRCCCCYDNLQSSKRDFVPSATCRRYLKSIKRWFTYHGQ
jgi:hypothetical protein